MCDGAFGHMATSNTEMPGQVKASSASSLREISAQRERLVESLTNCHEGMAIDADAFEHFRHRK